VLDLFARKQPPFMVINDTRPALTTCVGKAHSQPLTAWSSSENDINPGLKLTAEQRFSLIEQHDIVLIERLALIIKDPIVTRNTKNPHTGLAINEAPKVTSC
jgi:hypothetical protein